MIKNNSNVPALERAYRLMTALLQSPWPLGISDLARDLDLSKSTVHGLVHTLVDLGLLEKESKGRGYRPAGLVMDLWGEALLKGPFARAAAPLLKAFSERHGLTAIAGVYLQGRVLIVEAVLAPGFSVSAYPGQIIPSWSSALGKVLLSTHPPQHSRPLARHLAARVPLTTSQYLEEVNQVRQTGVALDHEEYIPGVSALAAAVPDSSRWQPLGAVWVVGLAPSLDDARMARITPELKSLAEEVGRRMDELRQENDEVEGKTGRRL